MGLGRGKKAYKMGLPASPWEGVHKYDDGLWEVNMFIKWVHHLFPERVWTNTMGLGRRKGFIKWVYHLFPGRVCTNTMGRVRFYKIRRSNLCVLGHFFCAVVGFLTIVALQPRFLLHTWVCVGLSHHNEPFMV